jgi:hypothetical protein
VNARSHPFDLLSHPREYWRESIAPANESGPEIEAAQVIRVKSVRVNQYA